jgi:hypothetical protein
MGRRTSSHHTGKISGRYGIGGGTAQPFPGILTLDPGLGQGQAAGSHGTVFTADALQSNVTRFHLSCTIKNRVNAHFLSACNHFLCSYINRRCNRVSHFRRLCNFCFFFFCH